MPKTTAHFTHVPCTYQVPRTRYTFFSQPAMLCQVIGEGGAGLSVLGSALLMVAGTFSHISVGSLIRHKANITITLKERYWTGNDGVESPAWTITVT